MDIQCKSLQGILDDALKGFSGCGTDLSKAQEKIFSLEILADGSDQ